MKRPADSKVGLMLDATFEVQFTRNIELDLSPIGALCL